MRTPELYRSAAVILLLAAVLMTLCSGAIANPDTTVRTSQGILTGSLNDDIAVYRGIPFAAAPVGELRWRPPVPPRSWAGSRSADQFGSICPQNLGESLPAWLNDHITAVGVDEDCLTLNIWTPVDHDTGLPVMVYIHGGNMKYGSGSYPVYDGGILARDGVVLVTINYRIGFLGRFAHPSMTSLQADEPLVNYGVMDQIAALEWVRKNIRAFGGDPDNVTIFGHSAGGVSVNALMVTPQSKGLFAKAIAQGSAVALDRSRQGFEKGIPGALEASSEDIGIDLATHFEMNGTDEEKLAAFRALPVEAILDYQKGLMITFNPSVDGLVIPDDIASIFERGGQHDVPYIGGSNSWEWNQIADIPLIGKWFFATAFLEGLSDDDLAIYDDQWTRMGVAEQWFGDMFVVSTRYLAGQMETVSSPAWLFYVTYVQENLRGEVPGAAHGMEIPFIFGNIKRHPEFQRPENVELTEQDLAWGDLVRAYWISFAKTGDPDGEGRPHWPRYDRKTDLTMELGSEFAARNGLNRERLDFLEQRALIRRAEFKK